MPVVVTACGLFDEDGEAEAAPTAPRLVGRIASVYEKDGFALVQGFSDQKLQDGLLLSTVGEEERSATLVVTGERSGRYAAADVKSGDVKVGDAVYSRPLSQSEDSDSLPMTPIGPQNTLQPQ